MHHYPDTSTPARLSVIIPTLNEADNIDPLLNRLARTLSELDWEVVFVDDDSSDGTRERIAERARRDNRIRFIHRIGRKGLSSACLEGILSSNAPIVGVMDADLQHDETILPMMYERLTRHNYDLAVGSRYVEGGGVGVWDSQRQRISKWAIRITKLLTRVEISDPMSGFFMFRRDAFSSAIHRASGLGFKILLDLLLSIEYQPYIVEIPYYFKTRTAGASKLTPRIAWQLVLLIIDKKIGHYIPARFVSFSLVGAFGVLVHFVALVIAYRLIGTSFAMGQSLATLAAMTSNYLLNNISTFVDKSLGGLALLRGWLTFVAVCSIGALANVGIARSLFHQEVDWAVSALAGVIVSAMWNYVVSAAYVWNER